MTYNSVISSLSYWLSLNGRGPHSSLSTGTWGSPMAISMALVPRGFWHRCVSLLPSPWEVADVCWRVVFLACRSASVQNTETTQTPAQGKLSEKTWSGVRGQVFLPGESRGQKSLAGCSPWGHRESDTTEMTWPACSGESAKRMLEHRGTGMSLLVPWLRLCAPSAGTWVWSLVRELRSSMHSATNHSNDSSKSAEAQLVEVAGTAPRTETSLFGGERQTPAERGSFPSRTCLKHTLQKEAPRLWTPPAASGDATEPCGRRRLAGSPLDWRHHCQGWRRCLQPWAPRCLTWEGNQETNRPNRVGRVLPCPWMRQWTPFSRSATVIGLIPGGPHPGAALPSVPPTRTLLFWSRSPPHPVLRALGEPSILPENSKTCCLRFYTDQTSSRFSFEGKVRMHLQEFDDQGQGCWKGETEGLSSSSLAFYLLLSSKVLAIYGFRLIILFSTGKMDLMPAVRGCQRGWDGQFVDNSLVERMSRSTMTWRGETSIVRLVHILELEFEKISVLFQIKWVSQIWQGEETLRRAIKTRVFGIKNASFIRVDLVTQWWRIHLQRRRPRSHRFDPWVGKMPWRRNWLSTPVSLPGKFQEQRSLAGYSPWGHKELASF